MESKNVDDFKEHNICIVQEAFRNYKANENDKIIQFLHVTVLLITGILTKSSPKTLPSLLLLMALIFMPFAYDFFYLKDLYNADVNMQSFFMNK